MMTSNDSAGAVGAGDEADRPEVHRSATLVRTRIDSTTSGHRPDPSGGRRPLPFPARSVLGVVLAVTGLAALILSTRGAVEGELERRVESRLVDAGLDPESYSVEFDARSGRVSGPLPDGWSVSRLSDVVDVDGAASVELDVTGKG